MNTAVEEQIGGLDALSLADLQREWVSTTHSPAPLISARLLRLALAWELQARAYGGLPRPVQQKLEQLATGKTRTRAPAAGMRLVREWNGTLHVVTIGEDQVIRWDERTWNSLSEVARAITGTRWSGPAFFGLKKKVAAA